MIPRPAVFLDRDGTLIEDRDYLGDPAGVVLLPRAADAVRRLNAAGLPVILVTNQSGIGRGLLSEEQYAAVHARLVEELAAAGATLAAAYHCPHAPDRQPPCDCRKPATGLFRRAAAEHRLDLGRSFYIGDRLRDVVPGIEAGGRGILVRSPLTDPRVPAEIPAVDSLFEAVERVLSVLPGN